MPHAETAILIGQPELCRRLERQLDLLNRKPISLGWVVTSAEQTQHGSPNGHARPNSPVLGSIDELEAIIARRKPGMALLTLPAVMKDQIASIRTRLRRLGVADRFMPTLEDQLAGIGPRTHIDIDYGLLLDRPPRQMVNETGVREVIGGKRVLITGAGGSIGSELCRIAARFEPELLVMVERSENALFEIDRQIARSHPTVQRKAVLHDVVEEQATFDLFMRLKPYVVFHAAAHKHVPMMEDHPGAAIDNNLFGTRSVADAADACGAERFVMISSDKAVNPTSIMGATKRLAELYVQAINQRSRTGFSMVRFGNVLGSSGSVLEIWARQIADGGPLTVTHPDMTRYFMTIPEAASLVIQSASLLDAGGESGEVFLLDMGEPIRVLDMACRFIRLHGLEPLVVNQPREVRGGAAGVMPIVFTGARPGEKLHEELSCHAEELRPTRHPEIDIWMVPPPDEAAVASMLANLSRDTRPASPVRLAEIIRDHVPEGMAEPVGA